MKIFFDRLKQIKEDLEFLESERLKLIPWQSSLDHARDLFSFAANENVGPQASWKPHNSVEESLNIIKEVFLPNFTFKIVLKESGKTIGNIGCERDVHREAIRSLELGYAVGEEFWNRGYATEASQTLIDFLFCEDSLDLEILSIQTNIENLPSQRVIEKLGFCFEGIRRLADRDYLGRSRTIKTYSMTRNEYESRKKK